MLDTEQLLASFCSVQQQHTNSSLKINMRNVAADMKEAKSNVSTQQPFTEEEGLVVLNFASTHPLSR